MELSYILIICLVVIALILLAVAITTLSKAKSRIGEADDKLKQAEDESKRMLEDAQRLAESQRKERLLEAKEEILKLKQESENENRKRKSELQNLETRIMQREESLDRRNSNLDRREHQLSSLQGQLDRRKNDIDQMVKKQSEELERISNLSHEEAHEELINRVRQQCVREEAQILHESEQRVKAQADKTAREIISTAIQRCAADQASEVTVTTVHIPSDDHKGRIIGREGRNIRTFEQVSGVSIVIDDTPETVILSSFDPVRREIARVTLENLVADGRIHPARIEEMYKKAESLVNERIQEAGEQAAFEVGIHDFHPDIITMLGRLRYRTSFGQNVLNHSVQVAFLAGMMANELGLDEKPARRAGLLHDIGKAMSHEIEGPHALIGGDYIRHRGEAPDIVHSVEAHHGEIEMCTVLDMLVAAADAISAARPGARREAAESYIKRLEKLESLCNIHDGVERTYAMQAGREIHVMVEPEKISDSQATVLAHDIARQIEDEVQFPGQIRVVVIRESRAVDLAK